MDQISPGRKPLGFLDLPGEIRTMIYRYTLLIPSADAEIIMKAAEKTKSLDLCNRITELGAESWYLNTYDAEPCLLRTCKQINREATALFYSNAVIHYVQLGRNASASDFVRLRDYLDKFSRARPCNIQKIAVVLLHEGDGIVVPPEETEMRDACIIAYYADAIAKQCGLLDIFHIEVNYWNSRPEYAGSYSHITALHRGFGMIHAREASVNPPPSPVFLMQSALRWMIEEEGNYMPMDTLYGNIYNILRNLWKMAKLVDDERTNDEEEPDAPDVLLAELLSSSHTVVQQAKQDEFPAGNYIHASNSECERDILFYTRMWAYHCREGSRIVDEHRARFGLYPEQDAHAAHPTAERHEESDKLPDTYKARAAALCRLRDIFIFKILDYVEYRDRPIDVDMYGSEKELENSACSTVQDFRRFTQFEDLLAGRDELLAASNGGDWDAFVDLFERKCVRASDLA